MVEGRALRHDPHVGQGPAQKRLQIVDLLFRQVAASPILDVDVQHVVLAVRRRSRL